MRGTVIIMSIGFFWTLGCMLAGMPMGHGFHLGGAIVGFAFSAAWPHDHRGLPK